MNMGKEEKKTPTYRLGYSSPRADSKFNWNILSISFKSVSWALIILTAAPTAMCLGFLAWRFNNRAKQFQVASGQYIGRIVKAEISGIEAVGPPWTPLSAGTVSRLNVALAQPRRPTARKEGYPACALRLVFADGYAVEMTAVFRRASLRLFANSPLGVFTAPRHERCIYAGRLPLQPLSPLQFGIVQKVQFETGPPFP